MDEESVRVEQAEPGMVIDVAADGRPLGVELTAPALTTLGALNDVLDSPFCPPPAGGSFAVHLGS